MIQQQLDFDSLHSLRARLSAERTHALLDQLEADQTPSGAVIGFALAGLSGLLMGLLLGYWAGVGF